MGASLGFIVIWPIILLIALLIKLSSTGPVFFVQKRVGLRGKEFTFLKFRTMLQNNDDSFHKSYVTKLIKNEFQESENKQKPLYKINDDFRVTKIGKFLRNWSLDEIPQLYNVLKGDMSLVGPRPSIPYEVSQYSAWHLQRLNFIPGITGIWQTTGRSKTTFNEMVRSDIQYIRNWSILLDFWILLRTVKAVLSREGAL